jgi:hypothetical protein
MRFPAFSLLAVATTVLIASYGCGPKNPPQTVDSMQAAAAASSSAAQPPCVDAPANPADVIAKEPAILNACLANAGKVDANLCGSAKIAVKLGRNGKVQNAEVAQSTLPIPVTDCVKARLAAMQFACPTDDSAVYTIPVGLPLGGPNGECLGMPGAPGGAPPP